MENDPVLGLIGLARRASKIAIGDEQVRDMTQAHKVRVVLTASDAGTGTGKKAAQYADKSGVPCITLPFDKAALGSALGRTDCAVCALSDIGMAAAAAEKLAARDTCYQQAAKQLSAKNVRIQSRKGLKKKKTVPPAKQDETRRK